MLWNTVCVQVCVCVVACGGVGHLDGNPAAEIRMVSRTPHALSCCTALLGSNLWKTKANLMEAVGGDILAHTNSPGRLRQLKRRAMSGKQCEIYGLEELCCTRDKLPPWNRHLPLRNHWSKMTQASSTNQNRATQRERRGTTYVKGSLKSFGLIQRT